MSRSSHQLIHVSKLDVDPDVQRGLDDSWVQTLSGKFELKSVGVLECSQRDDGSIVLVDGQHRHAAALRAGYDGELNCLVHEGLTRQEEAILFLTLNNSRKVQALAKFHVRVTAQDPVAMALAAKIHQFGWGIGQNQGRIAAVSALEQVYNGAKVDAEGERIDLVDAVMHTITAAWGHESTGAHAGILLGLGQIYARFGDECSPKLTKDLSKIRPVDVVAKARSIREGQGGLLCAAVAKVAVGLHNKGIRVESRLLPDWPWTR